MSRNETFAIRLKRLLEESGLSQNEVARRAGVPASVVNRAILHGSQMRADALLAVTRALDQPLSVWEGLVMPRKKKTNKA